MSHSELTIVLFTSTGDNRRQKYWIKDLALSTTYGGQTRYAGGARTLDSRTLDSPASQYERPPPPPTIEVRHQFLGLFSPLGLYRLTGSFVAKVTSLVSFLVKGPQTFS